MSWYPFIYALTTNLTPLLTHRIAKEAAAERFRSNKHTQRDMLASFIARGLTQDEVEAEIVLQL